MSKYFKKDQTTENCRAEDIRIDEIRRLGANIIKLRSFSRNHGTQLFCEESVTIYG
jgi:hypothetical protein